MDHIVTILGLIIGIVAALAAILVIPEVRRWLRLDKLAEQYPGISNKSPRNSKNTLSKISSVFPKAPPPSPHFRSFRIGNFEIPVMSVVGSPLTPFSQKEVIIHYNPIRIEDRPEYPEDLKVARDYLLQEVSKRDNITTFTDNILPRLDNIIQQPENELDERGKLEIFISLTSYSSLLCTNLALDYKAVHTPRRMPNLSKDSTIREAFCKPPYNDLSKSVLSNAPGVEVVVISRSLEQSPKDQLIIRQRSENVVWFRGYFQTSAAGYMSMEHRNSEGLPSPFVTAISEAKQEIADTLDLSPDDFKLIGVLLKWQDLHPAFYGYIVTGIKAVTLITDFKRDNFEGDVFAIPFEPENVLSHIANNKWTSTSAFAVIAALLAFYPRRRIEEIASRLPMKNYRDFPLA